MQGGYYRIHLIVEETEVMVGDLPEIAKFVTEPKFAARYPHSKPICFKVLCTYSTLPFFEDESTVNIAKRKMHMYIVIITMIVHTS